ncbi:hypothetical protein ACT453_33475, partial [Bacillus sp. D-CC]
MGSGQIVHNAGPGGAILAFLVGGFVLLVDSYAPHPVIFLYVLTGFHSEFLIISGGCDTYSVYLL